MSYTLTHAGGTGRSLGLALSVVIAGTTALWFFGGGPGNGFPMFGGQIGQEQKQDLSSAMPGGTSPQPYFGKQEYAPNVVVVMYHAGVPMLRREAKESQYGLNEDVQNSGKLFTRYFISQAALRAGETIESTIAKLLQDPDVKSAEYDFKVTRDQTLPNDPRFGDLWGLHNVGQSGGTVDADVDAPDAWDFIGPVAPTLVAVCDDGLQLDHPDLVANIYVNPGEIAGNGIDDDSNGFIDDVRGWDFSDGDNNVSPVGGASHGVHTSGTVGAVNNNGIGVAGIARNVRLMHCKMYGGANPYFTAFANAIVYAADNGARVISASYNIDNYPAAFSTAVQYARDRDVIYVNSAGNNSQQNPPRQSLRSISNNVIFVAATDRNDNLASFSNYGTLIEIAAPGVSILSTVAGSGYDFYDGTSMATPHVAGAAAVLRSVFPASSARQILDRLIGTADPKASLAGLVAGGRLNLNNALDTDTTPPSDPTSLAWLAYATQSLKIRFNGSGDDGLVGQASSYDIRISPSPINAGNFNTATSVNASIPPVNAGVPINYEIGGINPGTSVYVGIVAVDNLGNRSNLLAGGPFSTKPARTDGAEGTSWFSPTAGPWQMTTEQPQTGARSWSDSPGGNYVNGANVSLTSRAIGVAGSATLTYFVKYDLESNYDYLYCDISVNGGVAWNQVSRVTGNSGGWKLMSLPLPAQPVPATSTSPIRVRFRMTSDSSVVKDGVYIDNLSIIPNTTVFLDNMEGATGFTAESPWALTTSRFASPIRSWTDSPGGQYGNNVNVKLTSINEVNTSNLAGAQVSFKAYIDTENNYDYLRVYTAQNGGAYTERGSWTGTLTTWASYAVPAGPGGMTRIRFALTTDGSVLDDGVYVDDVAVTGEQFTLVP